MFLLLILKVRFEDKLKTYFLCTMKMNELSQKLALNRRRRGELEFDIKESSRVP